MVKDIGHVCNRGVDKRRIFQDRNDYQRFRENLFLLNNIDGKIRTRNPNIFVHNAESLHRNKLVEILKWSLMPNHFHLLLYEVVEGGILEFTKRLGNAYTKYFNLKNNHRSGYLFQNSSKIVRAGDEGYMPYIPIYIELNPADLMPGTVKEKIKFLKSYEWASLKIIMANMEMKVLLTKNFFIKFLKPTQIITGKILKAF